MNCQSCNSQINSPKLTGELCTACYFKARSKSVSEVKSNTEFESSTALIERPVENLPQEKESAIEEFDRHENALENFVEENQAELKEDKKPSVSKDSNGAESSEVKEIPKGYFLCSECNELHKKPEKGDYNCTLKHEPGVDKNQTQFKDKKYCQSCIERGLGLVLATREFRAGEFICDDCFIPLLENTLGYQVARAEIERVKVLTDDSLPLLEQFYDLLEIPTELRFIKSDNVLSNRNQIFNYHAKALVNQDLQSIVNNIEQLQVMLFQIKIGLEPLTDYINRVKADEREKANLESIKKGKTEVKKQAPSKVKADKEQKMANVMFPFIKDEGERLKKYREMAAKAREAQFDKTVGN